MKEQDMDANTRKKVSTSREDSARIEGKQVRYANRKEVVKAVKRSLPAAKEALEYLKNR